MKTEVAGSVKRSWAQPKLERFGSFVTATQACDKLLGTGDGYTFQGMQITCVS